MGCLILLIYELAFPKLCAEPLFIFDYKGRTGIRRSKTSAEIFGLFSGSAEKVFRSSSICGNL